MQKNLTAIFFIYCAISTCCFSASAEDDQTKKNNPVAREDPELARMVTSHGIEQVVMSPDGKHLAILERADFGHTVFLRDVDSGQTKGIPYSRILKHANQMYTRDAQSVTWVTNDLLALNYGVYSESVTLEGKHVADIGDFVVGKVKPADPESTTLLVYPDYDSADLALVNARTGRQTSIKMPASGKLRRWAVDSNGQIRAVMLSSSDFWDDNTVISDWYKPPGNQPWEKLAEFKPTDNYWMPAFVPDKENSLVVFARGDRDTYAVFDYNTSTRSLDQLIASHPQEDIAYADGLNQSVLNSFSTNGMKPHRYWFDPEWSALQTAVDQILPESINIILGDPKSRVLVYTYSDVNPGRWYTLDVPTMKLTSVGTRRYAIKPLEMRHTEIVSYPSADGMTIPAFLTRPDDGKALKPAILIIHGGPLERDQWGWDLDTQLLAKRGYVVLRPQIRGSVGFGKKFREAGFREWGRAMQDDITGGVNYLVNEKIADPKRICIYGTSYGGYAAMWGLVATPDLYRCGISFAGVSDIAEMYDDWYESTGDKELKEIRRVWIGDITTDRAKFDSVSPGKHADQIKAPLLIMHGEIDKSVPISHSKKMIEALESNHKVYEWLEFPNRGHFLGTTVDLTLYYKTLFKFLDRYNPPDPKSETPDVQSQAQ